MNPNETEPTNRLHSPEQPFAPLPPAPTTTTTTTMMMFDEPGATLTSSPSSISIGSRTAEEKAEDEVFDKIEDLLGDLMRAPSSRHLPCRVFQWPLPDDPSRVLNAVIVISKANS